jgi:ABC-type branched-subunit amino acid transport system ATPase component
MTLLETRNVSKAYGAFRALEAVSMTVNEGEIVSVVGPNGAGKTTLVNLLTGLMAPSSGEVLFMGENIAGVGPVTLADRGLARAFQLIAIFPRLTVAETIAAAVVSRQKSAGGCSPNCPPTRGSVRACARWRTSSASAPGSTPFRRRCRRAKRNCSMLPPPSRSIRK